MTMLGRAAAVALLLPGLALAQSPAVVSTTVERSAVVESVNGAERSVLLRGEDGALATIIAGPAVRNFAQIRPGDRVVTMVTDTLAVSAAGHDGRPPRAGALIASRAAPGQRPALTATRAERVRVRVEAVDRAAGSVTILSPDGLRRVVRVTEPRLRARLPELTAGEELDVVTIETVTLRVVPAG